MILRKSHLLFFIILVTLSLLGSTVLSEINSEVTGIDVKKVDGVTEIEITSTSPLSYTMYTSDPYRVVVELQNADLKGFSRKVFDRAGVMEIIPSMIEGESGAAKLEIALTNPVDIKPMQKGGLLLLTFKTPDAVEEEESPVSGMTPAGTVLESIELSKSGNKLLVTIDGNGEMTTKVLKADNNKLIIDLPGVTAAIDSPKVYEPPVEGIRVGKYPDKTRLVFDLTGPAEHDLMSDGNKVVVSFDISGTAPVAAEMEDIQQVQPLDVLDKEVYVGEKISIDFLDADVNHVFRLIADISGYNIVVSPKVKENISMRLKNVPWDQALEVILRNYNLSKRVDGNVIRIAKTNDLAREDDAIAKAKEAQEKVGDLITETYPINFAKPKEVEKVIKGAKILTKRGSISIDERTSSLIIKDVEQNHAKFIEIIETLDKPTPQVQIEARIVEIKTNYRKELGIQWGLTAAPSANTRIGGLDASAGEGFSSEDNLLINLPAAVGEGAGGAIGFGYIGATALRSLDLQLSAMESGGGLRVVSNPRIIVLDSKEATITQGTDIPYETTSSEGTTTQFVQATLELSVTPHVTPGGTILMEVDVKNDTPDDSVATSSGSPGIFRKNAETEVMIKDGDTLTIGGIMTSSKDDSSNKFPLLGDIPVMGWLFKNKKVSDETTELLIFITPRIIL